MPLQFVIKIKLCSHDVLNEDGVALLPDTGGVFEKPSDPPVFEVF